MKATLSLKCSSLPSLQPFSARYRKRLPSMIRVFAAMRDGYNKDHGRIVDENMVVLKMRIHDMKMIERNDDDDDDAVPSMNWMEWEKRYYCSSYKSDVCEAVGFLQSQLMNTRPGLALAMVMLVALSVPTSAAMVVFHFMEITKWALSSIHL